MEKLLYYPNFEIQDERFLKFALLYIDEIRPIIPVCARNVLSDSMNNIISNTELINPYESHYEDGYLATFTTIEYLEKRKFFEKYSVAGSRIQEDLPYNYILYADKYTYEFENYCLEHRLGKKCNEGIILNKEVAFSYMSILAEIISKDMGIDMITDNRNYADPVLRARSSFSCCKANWLDSIQREIEFYVPVDMNKIPLEKFIELRSDYKFERARKGFVIELNRVLDSYDNNVENIDLKNINECRQEMYGLLKEIGFLCARVAIGGHSFNNMCTADMGTFDFWSNLGEMGISLKDFKQDYFEIRDYLARIEGKKQARKYLAKLRQLRPETL